MRLQQLMSSVSSSIAMNMPAECRDFSIDCADELEMKIVSKRIDKMKQLCTFESDSSSSHQI